MAFKILASKLGLTLDQSLEIFPQIFFLGCSHLKKRSHLVSTVIIWRLSELSLYFYKASGSTNETPVNFSFILQALEWLFLQGELGDKRQSLDLCQYPPTEPVLGSILLGRRTDRHKGSKTSTGPSETRLP